MDFSWLGAKRKLPKNYSELGQSTVEYIMLFALVGVLVSYLFESESFQRYFGDDGVISSTLRFEYEYSYRHARPGREPFKYPSYSTGEHESYNGRFFSAADPYP